MVNSKNTPSEGPHGIDMLPEEFSRLVLESPLVLILVGPNRVVFNMPKNLICAKSSFFDKALNGASQEGVEQTITLPEDDPTIFSQLGYWMCHNQILSIPEALDVMAPAVLVQQLIHLYMMAGKYLMEGALDETYAGIIEVLYNRARFEDALTLMPASLVEQVWEASSPESQLRFLVSEYLARAFIRTGTSVGKPIEQYKGCFTAFPEFGMALVTSMVRSIRMENGIGEEAS
ncbi:MAG: hypothetical protein Q9187_008189 [Circinaria calcarea]